MLASFEELTNRLFDRDTFEGQEDGEEILLLLRKHPLFLLRSLTLPLAVLLGTLFVVAQLFSGRQRWDSFESALAPLLGLISLAMLGWMILAFIEWENDHFIVTTSRAISARRIYKLTEERREAKLERVQDVGLKIPNSLAYLFDYGDLLISTGSATGGVEFGKVPKPLMVKEVILQQAQALSASQEELRRSTIRESLERELGYRGTDGGNKAG